MASRVALSLLAGVLGRPRNVEDKEARGSSKRHFHHRVKGRWGFTNDPTWVVWKITVLGMKIALARGGSRHLEGTGLLHISPLGCSGGAGPFPEVS